MGKKQKWAHASKSVRGKKPTSQPAHPKQDNLAGLGARIAEVATLVGGKNKLAEMVGISVVQIFRYISGKNIPNIKFINDIAVAANVNLNWLVTGQGQIKSNDFELLGKVGKNLSSLEELGWSPFRIADQSGLPEGRIKGIVDGYVSPSIEDLVIISSCTPISVDFLLTGRFLHKKEFSDQWSPERLTPQHLYSSNTPSGFAYIKPFEPWEKFAREWPIGPVQPFIFSESYIGHNLESSMSKLSITKCRDNAMEPTINTGDYVLVSDDYQHNGKFSGTGIYLLSKGGMPTICRIQLLFGDEILLKFDNQNYKEVKCKLSDLTPEKPLSLVGRVIWHAHRVY